MIVYIDNLKFYPNLLELTVHYSKFQNTRLI